MPVDKAQERHRAPGVGEHPGQRDDRDHLFGADHRHENKGINAPVP